MWHQKKQFRAGIKDWTSSVNFWNKSIITTEHFTITISVIAEETAFFSEIEKIHTNQLSPSSPLFFPKEVRRRKVLQKRKNDCWK